MSGVKKILIIKMSSLGDLFHALPAVHCLKKAYGAKIDWCVNKSYESVVRCFDDVSRVITFPRSNVINGVKQFLKEIRTEQYDLVIDMQGLLKSAMVAMAARGARKIGPSFRREGSGMFYREVAGKNCPNRHAVDRVLDVIDYLGLERKPIKFPVTFPVFEVSGSSPKIAIAPVSRWKTKNWPVKNFAEVARQIAKRMEASFHIIGGPEDRDRCEAVADAIGGNVRNYAAQTSIEQTGGLLKKMDLLISNDSGPVHMAAAVGTPALVIFGATVPKLTGPYGDRHKVLTADIECRPCKSRTCRVGGTPCLAMIEPARVVETAMEMLASGKDS